MAPDAAKSRTLVYELAVQMASWGATTFLVGEYTDENIATLPEFAIADGILRLRNGERELTRLREFEVLKLRGTQYVSGRHFFEISPHGIEFYPRVRTPIQDDRQQFDVRDRVPTGVPGLDEMLDGGLPRSSTTVIEGGNGDGEDAPRPALSDGGGSPGRTGDSLHARGNEAPVAGGRRQLRLGPYADA